MWGSLYYGMNILLFSVETQHTDEDRAKIQRLADDGTDGAAGNVINEPGRRTDETVLADALCIGIAEADGGSGHTDDGKHFENEVLRRRFFPEQGEGKHIASKEHKDKADKPGRVVCMELFLIQENDSTEEGDRIEKTAHICPQHEKVDAEQQAADHLESDNACAGLLLEGQDAEGHCSNTKPLRDQVICIHKYLLFFLCNNIIQ